MTYDYLVVGGGITGLSTAYHLLQAYPESTIVVLEKEAQEASHQSGRNSGVIHSGIYYSPGSLKAKFCGTARKRLIEFCDIHQVPYEICGKVIVATSDTELAPLETLLKRGSANGVKCRKISSAELAEIEPHVSGRCALHVADAGIIDFPQVCRALKERILSAGGEIAVATELDSVVTHADYLTVRTARREFVTRHIINCAGLQADRVAQKCGVVPQVQIVPFRGEYFTLADSASKLCRNLIYPVPDSRFPFLGVHLTRTPQGHIHCGPNAVLAFTREGYRWRDISARDLWETLTYSGFLRLAAKHFLTGAHEMYRSLSKQAFTRSLQRLVPEVQVTDLQKARAGVRAQAIHENGDLAQDFIVQQDTRSTHLLNAPSPGATSALEIGRYIQEIVGRRFNQPVSSSNARPS